MGLGDRFKTPPARLPPPFSSKRVSHVGSLSFSPFLHVPSFAPHPSPSLTHTIKKKHTNGTGSSDVASPMALWAQHESRALRKLEISAQGEFSYRMRLLASMKSNSRACASERRRPLSPPLVPIGISLSVLELVLTNAPWAVVCFLVIFIRAQGEYCREAFRAEKGRNERW